MEKNPSLPRGRAGPRRAESRPPLGKAAGVPEKAGGSTAAPSAWHLLATRPPATRAEVDAGLGPGQPMEAGLLGRMENVLGTPLGNVRVHTGAEGDRLTSAAAADAFALGSHVAFAGAAFRPGTLIGDALIAHELAHVAQQRGGGGSSGESDAEADANRSVGGLLGAGSRSAPRVRSGLALRRCTKSPLTLAQAQANFNSNNTGMLGGLTKTEASKVEAAVGLAAKDNPDLAIGFYSYYSSHEINKTDAATTAKWKTSGQYALTSPNSDTEIRADLVEPATANERLAGILLHEFTHTRHLSSPMGSRDFQEGDAYGTELFFARRHKDAARVTEIEGIYASPGKVVMGTAQQKVFLELFLATYGGLAALYEVIDSGASKHKGSPFDGMTKDKARELSAELIGAEAAKRSADLTSALAWIKANPTAYPP